MESSIKKVFMTLIKVPVYIAIMYLITNIVFFALFYLRALGVSYVVMQTAVENNYIPASEAQALNKSLQTITSPKTEQVDGTTIDSSIANKFMVFVDTSGTKTLDTLYNENSSLNGSFVTNGSTNTRVQYGREITVGVGYLYKIVLPMTKYNSDVKSYNKNKATNVVRITYKVPGLKYYPDL